MEDRLEELVRLTDQQNNTLMEIATMLTEYLASVEEILKSLK